MAPPLFPADHIGSLLRPQYLLDANLALAPWGQMHTRFNTDAAPALIEALHTAEARAIKDVVLQQLEKGVEPITSGEFGRSSFVSGFFETLEGVEVQVRMWEDFRTEFPIIRPYLRFNIPGRDVPIAVSKIRWKKSAYMDEFLSVRNHLPEEKWKAIKITIPAPNWSHTQLKDGRAYTPEAYEDESEYLKDVGEAVRQEVLALYDAGCRFVQIDDPMIAMLCDEAYLAAQEKEGKTLDNLLDPAIFAHNAVARDVPADLTLSIHLCRGNQPKGITAAIGGFDALAPRLFNGMKYKRFALEFDDPEITGSFSPLQYLPKDKVVVLGVVTTKDAALEDVGELKGRVHEAADVVAKAQGRSREDVLRENVAVSPSCGFASLKDFHGIHSEDVQWSKLEIVKELAQEVFGST